MLAVRPARSDADVEAVRAMFLAYAGSRPGDPALVDFPAEIAALPGAYAPPRGALLVALWCAEPAGCVAFHRWDPDTCEMKRLYVRPDHRGRGVGRALAVAVLDHARAAGYRRMVLDSIPSMAAAQALYESIGFRLIPPYRHNPNPGTRYYGIDLTG